ncbi:MAG: LysM peptidoglycan-binding domain-containing protein [Planctomycetaceae bacterium]|jgi:nucleoid-associated protein YgaU|nr:LysM peptidoglycan-binding domain-containing protein [Planctomycetaceae bacterium]
MSKNEKRNSETNSLESKKLNNSGDNFSMPTETLTNTATSVPTDKSVQKSDQKTELSDGHSDNENIPKRLFQLPTFVPVLFRETVNLFHRTVDGVRKYGSFGYAQGKKAMAFLCRFAAFFVPKKTVSDGENNDIGNTEMVKESSKNTPPSNQSAVQTAAIGNNVVAKNKIDHNVNENINDIEDEEEYEEDHFRWLNLGFKVTAVAAVILLLTGGYFGVKLFLGKTTLPVEETEKIQPETSELMQQQQQQESDTNSDAKKDVLEKIDPTPVKSLQQPTVTPEKESIVKKTTEETVKEPNKKTTENSEKPEELAEKPKIPKKNETVTEPFKEEIKTVPNPEKEITASNNNLDNTQTASDNWNNIQPAETVTDFSNPIVAPTVAAPFPAVTTNSSVLPESPVSLDSPLPPEKPEVVQNPVTAPTPPTETKQSATTNLPALATLNTKTPVMTTPTTTATVPTPASTSTPATTTPPPTAIVPTTASSTPTIPVATGTTPLTPLKMQPSATDSVSSSNFPISDISGNQSLTIPKSDNEIQTFSPLSTFPQPSSEPSLNIPEQPKMDSVTGGFSKAPTPPEMNTPIPSPSVEPMIPVVATKKEETVPAIPQSGTIQPITDTFDSALTSSLPPEPSLAIPTDSVTFAQPAVPSTAAQPMLVTSTPYVPPTFNQPTTTSTPLTSNTETNTTFPKMETTMNNGTITKTNESSLEIPKETQRSDVTVPATTVPAATGSAQTVTAPAILPQHAELAKVEPPLGSQLQNQVRGMRNQESSEPKLRFGSNVHAPTGAVRYHPKSTVQNVTELIPSQPMPVNVSDPNSNPLIGLLPTGHPQPEAANSLPPLETAPKSVTAIPNPGYRHSLNRDLPASVQPESSPSETLPSTVNNSERRAKRFRWSDEEITQSPITPEQYTVQENETYMTISDKFFRTSRLFRALAEHNRQKYGTDYKLSAGTVIEIPPADYLKSNYAEVLPRSGQRPEKNTTISASTIPAPVQGLRYVVRADDTVFRIATNQLRDSSRWQEIMDMNSDKLRNPRDLQPGMEIILPATTATQTTYGRR